MHSDNLARIYGLDRGMHISDSNHCYFRDFVIVKNTDEFYIVEIKYEYERNHMEKGKRLKTC